MADINPGDKGGRRLREYWTKGPGLGRWVGSPTPWTTLKDELLAAGVPAVLVKKLATTYFHIVFGFYPGSDLNRVTHGHPPRGKVIGPG